MPKTSTTKRATSKSTKESPTRSGNASNKAEATGNKANAIGNKAGAAGSRTGAAGNGQTTANKGKANAGKAGDQSPVEDSRLREFFVDELKDIYWAEQKLVKTLPKMQKAATSEELQEAFASHLEETKTHVERLEQVFKLMGEKATAKKCDAMEGITEEGASIIEDTEKGTATRDVGLVMAGQKAEHYEIATYGGLAQLARTLGHDDVADLLAQTLEEEKSADLKLTEIAENSINYEASREPE